MPDDNTDYNSFPILLQKVHWKVDTVKRDLETVKHDLETECAERKETDKMIFEKFDTMNHMIIYQLCAAILTLVVVVAMFVLK